MLVIVLLTAAVSGAGCQTVGQFILSQLKVDICLGKHGGLVLSGVQ